MAKKPEIYETTDYGQFKQIIGNRPIFQQHLNRMVEELQEDNFLPGDPIRVNERMEVMDGQHRLLAAKKLGLPIYYIIIPGATLTNVQKANVGQRPWKVIDFLESYIALGKKDYIELAEFMEEYRVSIATAILLLGLKTEGKGGNERRGLMKDFKSGKFSIVNRDQAERVASLLNEIRRYSPDTVWTHREFQMALLFLDNTSNIDPKILLTKLDQHDLTFTRRPSIKGYLQEIEDIINFGTKSASEYIAVL